MNECTLGLIKEKLIMFNSCFYLYSLGSQHGDTHEACVLGRGFGYNTSFLVGKEKGVKTDITELAKMLILKNSL